jgi:hypothetical protein
VGYKTEPVYDAFETGLVFFNILLLPAPINCLMSQIFFFYANQINTEYDTAPRPI